jgi:1-deoxy-D-xylulose-5-phosphate reductoisomerase
VIKKLNLGALTNLQFSEINESIFPATRLARESINSGGDACCVLNLANEVAVETYLQEKISYLSIADVVAEGLERFAHHTPCDSLDALMHFNIELRERLSAEVLPSFYL